jgi:putative NADH-flavin reductase
MGATSGIGEYALNEAKSRAINVRAFARGADAIEAGHFVEPVAGDARSHDDVVRAIDGARAVIYALGIKERLSMIWEKETLFSDTTRVLLDSMLAKGVSRLVVVTGYGAGRSKDAMSLIERTGHRAILGRPYEDKDRQEEMIMKSDLDWTIMRPVVLTNGRKTGRAKVITDPARWRNGLVSRADVASILIQTVEQGLYVKADTVIA